MEIPKNLQQEIISVQHKLINAIREHQVCMIKLKDDPNNPSIRDQMHEIQLHIISLGRCQKQVLQRLRKEVQVFKADNTNGSKVSVTSLLGLNNNNHITNNNETKHETTANGFETKPSKEHYEEVITNGDVPSPAQHNDCAKRGPSSVETISGEDDIVEVPMDENSNEKQEKTQKQQKSELEELEDFLCCLGLITKSKATELQNKRAERKRRSTANPQFVYSLLEQPIKRQKRYSYLQSGNAPHTRQTTARMNGPSPPPNKAQTTKSTSSPVRTVTKSLIPVQKSTTRPNILRNADSKVFVNRNKIEDNTRPSLSSAKSVQSINSKTVHIPGLPSSLTIERIENDSVVCISCRNPGTLTVCENCSSNYHVTCHTRSPALPRTCPKCALIMGEEKDVQKNEEAENNERMEGENKRPRPKKSQKLATTTIAPGAIGKTRQDSEIYKTSGGLHKVDTIEEKRIVSASYGIGQLPLSTFLIPITSNNTSNVDQSEDSQFSSVDTIEQQHDVIPRNPVVLSQHQRSGITYIQAEDQMSYSYQLPSTSLQHEKHQSYLIVKKITEPIRRIDQLISGQSDNQSRSAVLNYQLPTTSNCNTSLEAGIVVAHSLLFGRNNRKKQTSPRAVPGLRRIIGTERLLPVTGDYQLDRATLNGRKPWAKLSRGKLCINQQSVSRPATEILLSSYGDESNDEQLQIARSTVGPTEEGANLNGRGGKHRSTRSGHAIIHSLLSGNNRSHIITDRAREQSRCFSPNDRDCPLLRQQLCRPEHEQQLDPREQPDKPATVQLQRCALTRFFEHVKLEEAHISAPFGTKLVHKNEVALERGELRISENSAREGARDQRYNDGAVGIEAPLSSSNSDEDSPEDSRMQREGWITSNIEVPRNSRDNNAANWSPPLRRPSSVSPIPPSDCELTRVDAQSPALFRSITPENERSGDAFQSDDTYLTKGQKDDETLYTAQSNLSSELRNEVSVPDDKADTERQDLPSGGRRSSFSSNTSSSSGHSDTPEQAMNDANSLSVSHISGDMYELLNIDPISPEGREELARYVSAMREDDRSDTATG